MGPRPVEGRAARRWGLAWAERGGGGAWGGGGLLGGGVGGAAGLGGSGAGGGGFLDHLEGDAGGAFPGEAGGALAGAAGVGGAEIGGGGEAFEGFGEGGGVVGREQEGSIAGDVHHGADGGGDEGDAGGHGFGDGHAVAFKGGREDGDAGTGVEGHDLFAGEPAGDGDVAVERMAVDAAFDGGGMEAAHAGEDEAVLGAGAAEEGEGVDEALDVLMGVEGGDA